MITDLYDTTLDTLLINLTPSRKRSAFSAKSSQSSPTFNPIISSTSPISPSLSRSDLKPGNILYRRGSVALCDWGSAAPEGHRGLLPTLGYRPPELLLWDRNGCTARWSGACDVWSWAFRRWEG